MKQNGSEPDPELKQQVNAPELSALGFRAGTHGKFLRHLRRKLAAHDGLADLAWRETHDPAIALLDGWASLAEVLSFYQERILNEAYLRTATDPLALQELARLVGYRVRPGVAAEAPLAFEIEAAADGEVEVPAGTRAQSLPRPGELPQPYETVEPLAARREWNRMRPARTRRQTLDPQHGDPQPIYLRGTAAGLRAGDPLLVELEPPKHEAPPQKEGDPPQKGKPLPYRVVAADPDRRADQTLVWVEPWHVEVPSAVAKRPAADTGQPATGAGKDAARSADQPVTGAGKDKQEQQLERRIAELIPRFQAALDPGLADLGAVRQVVSDAIAAEGPAAAPPPGATALVRPAPLALEPRSNEELVRTLRSVRPAGSTGAATPGDIAAPEATAAARPPDTGAPAGAGRAAAAPAAPAATVTTPAPPAAGTTSAITTTPSDTAATTGTAATVTAARQIAGVHALRVRAALFGHNAPRKLTFDRQRPRPADEWLEWSPAVDEDVQTLFLDNDYPAILPGSYVALLRPVDLDEPRPPSINIARVVAVAAGARTAYGISGRCTTLYIDTPWWEPPKPLTATDLLFGKSALRLAREFRPFRETAVLAQSEALPLADVVDPEPVKGADIRLDRLYPGLPSRRKLVVSGELEGLPGLVEREEVELAEAFAIEPATERDAWHTLLSLTKGLRNRYRRETVEIFGNVARATHGETREQVLGSGDGRVSLQRFTLERWPLTFTSTAEPGGVASSLTVRVNGVAWPERPFLQRLGPGERGYVRLGTIGRRVEAPLDQAAGEAPAEAEHRTTVVFGTGEHGARLPTGEENVTATYRVGLGRVGNAARDQITMLATRPFGVKAVTNPVAATGGADREPESQIRRNVPLGLGALGRLVAPQDYEDFAQAFPGVGKARARWRDAQLRDVIDVTIAGAANIPLTDESPLVKNLKQAMRTFGDPYHPVELMVFERVALLLRARLAIDPEHRWEQVEREVRARLVEQLSFERRTFGQPVPPSAVVAAIHGVAAVRYVDLDYLEGLPGGLANKPEELRKRLEELLRGRQPGEGGDRAVQEWVPAGGQQIVFLLPEIPEAIQLEQIHER